LAALVTLAFQGGVGVSWLLGPPPAAAGEHFAKGFLAACGEPCIITANGGGRLDHFLALAAAVKAQKRTVIIAGPCFSACAIFADFARENVCITAAARFGFHRSSNENDPPQSPDIAAWVEAHGGYPANSSGKLTMMEAAAVGQFWRTCPGPDTTHGAGEMTYVCGRLLNGSLVCTTAPALIRQIAPWLKWPE
jgi:hypothetical protein